MTETVVEQSDGEFYVPAELIAPLLKLEVGDVPSLMKENVITSACERGEQEDIGTYRLTFWHDRRRARVIIDDKGAVLKTSTVSFANRFPDQYSRPRSMREQ